MWSNKWQKSFHMLARQLMGNRRKLWKRNRSVYENDTEFIDFFQGSLLIISRESGLIHLGLLLGLPRPWVEIPMLQEALLLTTFHI